MKKTLISMAVLSVISSSTLAFTVADKDSPYQDPINTADGLTVEEGATIQNQRIEVTGGKFTNDGLIQTKELVIFTEGNSLTFGDVTANKVVFKGADTNSYGDNFILERGFSTDRLEILDAKFTDSEADYQTGLTIEDPTVLKSIGELYIESNGSRTGLRIGKSTGGKKGQTFEIKSVTLQDKTGNQDARVEIFNDNNVNFRNVEAIGDKGHIQLNDSSKATIETVTVRENSRLTLQTYVNPKTQDPKEYKPEVTLKEITLEKGAKIQASVFADNKEELEVNYSEQTMPALTLKGENVTMNLAADSLVDFGGWRAEDNSDWRPEDIIVDIQSMTINVADSSSNSHVYLTGVEGNLKTKAENIHVIGAAENNTGNAEADLTKLANVVKTNIKVVEDNIRENELNCLPGVQLEQLADDISDGATGVVADGCPGCTATNVKITGKTDNPNVHGIAEMAALGLHIWRNEIDDMHRRVGELRDSSAQSNGLWTRVYHGKAEYGDQNVINRYTAFQFGYDRQVRDGFWLGGAFSYTDGDNNFDYGDGDSDLYTFSGYGSWLFKNGVYLDLVGKVGRMKNAFDIRFNDIKSTGDYHTNAASLSAEMGWRYFATEELYLEPQVQMWYGHVFDADYHTSTGIKVENDSVDSLVGRVGVKMGYKDSQGRGGVFLKASVLHDWEGDAKFRYSKGADVSRTLTESLGGTWYEYGLGADYNATDQVHLYADVEAGNGGEVDTDYRFNVGVRYAW
ncbi:autotransporter outer membrane beta-barrel domain-containing protein [Parasutterella secunda]|uniref:autotransporter outer membrane beta-barrel domain-containing protein n=1 Tax=Parasutterella secunda TaxID=626947 RepID=UPI0021ABBB8F|nr:autotransporter outer membrane beta-barrel domain-containing protein [Parasutterella secunda]MCR8919620.1 autotransporter outer membrane beta-barrel domain-containing protein [Parasutterella secunda]